MEILIHVNLSDIALLLIETFQLNCCNATQALNGLHKGLRNGEVRETTKKYHSEHTEGKHIIFGQIVVVHRVTLSCSFVAIDSCFHYRCRTRISDSQNIQYYRT